MMSAMERLAVAHVGFRSFNRDPQAAGEKVVSGESAAKGSPRSSRSSASAAPAFSTASAGERVSRMAVSPFAQADRRAPRRTFLEAGLRPSCRNVLWVAVKLRGVAALTLLFCASSASAAERLQYNRDIRPILAENCFACHGPDSASRKADLRLDNRDHAIKMGAIVPDDPDESELLRRVESDDKAEIMPPSMTKKTLTKEQKQLLRRWIEEGAQYQQHWSLIAPVRPPVPEVKDEAWVKNPIDRFVLARLEERGLRPAPEADRRTLARRLSLDLTGLPPDPAVVEAFVGDKSPNEIGRAHV